MASHHHCQDFSRTELLRRAGAEAGRGLPAIEPGMPAPAGTGLSRRSFMLRSAGAMLSVYGASGLGLGPLEEGIARAAAGGGDPVLVSVFLEGGIDSLSLLAPVGDPRYRRLRRRLALPESAGIEFSEDDRLRWHPAAKALATLHGEGKVTVFPSIGYDHPDQSHFTSRHFWEVGSLDARASTGWMGRYLDQVGSPDNPLQGLALGGSLAPALASARVPVAAIKGPGGYKFWGRGVWGEVDDLMLEAVADIGSRHAGAPLGLGQAGSAAVQAARLREQLVPFATEDDDKPAFTSPVEYPDAGEADLPEQLAGLAAMLGAGLPIRCVAVSGAGDFDTHDNQPDDFERQLKVTADSLLAFQRDLEARGLADRVLIHVWSEFGRRAEENASLGTDHGAGGAGFLIGTRARGRMIGEFPGLSKLDADGNLRATSDFRGVYAALIDQWLGGDAGRIIPGASKIARPQLVR